MTRFNPYRLIFTFVLLCPYFVFFKIGNQNTPIWQDMLYAAAAFGIGYAIFPDKKQTPPDSKNNSDILDRE